MKRGMLMKFEKKRGLKKLKASLALMSLVVTMISSNISTVFAEQIIHTHIWATKYDDSKHWEYCTVCDKIKDSQEHKYTDHWRDGKESCWHYNYSTRVCDCGYSYKYIKPHTTIREWTHATNRILHYKSCVDCGTWKGSERCSNAKGTLSCKNPGTCTTCGGVTTKDNHYIVAGGKCRDCGVKLIETTQPQIKYSSDYSKATVTFDIKPVVKELTLTGKMIAYVPEKNSKSATWSSKKNSDSSYTYTLEHIFNKDVQRKSTYYAVDHYMAANYNNTSIYIDQKTIIFSLVQDKTAPTITEIKQKDQKRCNDWATIKELTINGTEDLSDIVTITIKDKETGDIIVDKATADVKDGKYTYKCTPPLEGPVEGRKYIITVVDQVEHKVDKEFTIYKTDCRAPLLRSEKEYVEWSQTKNLALELTDYGSGAPATSLSNQTSYKNAVKTGDKYYAKYKFDEENYGVKTYNIYLRDGLGNATKEVIKVGKIDNTKPTIEELKFALNQMEIVDSLGGGGSEPVGALITVVANDKNTKLNAEGSGVCGYALTKTNETPKAEEWKETDTLEAKEAGTYYLWVKDRAGNLADVKVLKVKDDFSVEIVEDIPVEDEPKLDNPKDEDDKKKDDKGDDNTPKTGDNTPVLVVALMAISSLIVLVIIRRKKSNLV